MASRDFIKLKERKFIVHEGLTELEHMKLEMFRTVLRNGVRALVATGSAIILVVLVRLFLEACGSGFWP